MIFNMTGGGGNPLNFKVVGGTNEPSNPKENTIWVNTDKEITGWHFTSKQPEDMKEGEVWFSTGKPSTAEFNALKKNNVTVYPQNAKQMVSGTLKDVTAKSYQNGEWVDLLEEGQIFPPTDGWIIQKIRSKATLCSSAMFDGNTFKATVEPNTDGAIARQYFDYTDIKTIEIYFHTKGMYSQGNGGFLFLATDYQFNENTNEIISKWASATEVANGFMRIDVSGISNKHWLIAGASMWASTCEVEIIKIKAVA